VLAGAVWVGLLVSRRAVGDVLRHLCLSMKYLWVTLGLEIHTVQDQSGLEYAVCVVGVVEMEE
jgi:hypothetical protein